ncbi:MAG: hypothetical protein KGJ94_05860 [Xanthomonadaceae bacterium]|nr:hypothetical protein [Xanthomonadaceae bacterium]
MNKQIFFAALFALGTGVAIAMPAFAQSRPGDAQASGRATAREDAKPAASGTQAGKRSVPPLDSRMCIRDTGSHIPPPKGQCLPVAGNSYSQKDIQRTGATSVGQALQMLDPSVQIRGGGH